MKKFRAWLDKKLPFSFQLALLAFASWAFGFFIKCITPTQFEMYANIVSVICLAIGFLIIYLAIYHYLGQRFNGPSTLRKMNSHLLYGRLHTLIVLLADFALSVQQLSLCHNQQSISKLWLLLSPVGSKDWSDNLLALALVSTLETKDRKDLIKALELLNQLNTNIQLASQQKVFNADNFLAHKNTCLSLAKQASELLKTAHWHIAA